MQKSDDKPKMNMCGCVKFKASGFVIAVEWGRVMISKNLYEML